MEIKSIELVKNERIRQVTDEGYYGDHDDQETSNQLIDAAIVYATPTPLRWEIIHKWPWDKKFFKPDRTNTYDGRIRELTKAGALICAEIDRLIREKERVEGWTITKEEIEVERNGIIPLIYLKYKTLDRSETDQTSIKGPVKIAYN